MLSDIMNDPVKALKEANLNLLIVIKLREKTADVIREME